jgi:hypothetical protein
MEATAVIKVVTAAAATALALAASQVQVQALEAAALPAPTAPTGLYLGRNLCVACIADVFSNRQDVP